MLSNAVERVHDCNPVDNPAVRLLLEDLLARGHAKLQISRETRRGRGLVVSSTISRRHQQKPNGLTSCPA